MKSGHIRPLDILIVKDGATTGKISLVRSDFPFAEAAVNEHIFRFDLDQTRADARYVFRYLHSADGQRAILADFRGSTVGGIGRTWAKGARIPLPPLPEQRRIADILDRADNLRAQRRRALEMLEGIPGTVFDDLFGSSPANTIPLRDLTDKITDGTHQSPKWAPEGVPFLFVSNLTGGSIDFTTHKFVSNDTHAELTRNTSIARGDVLYTAVGSYGIPVVVETDQPFIFQRHIAHIKPKRGLLEPHFLRGALSSTRLRRVADRVARGVAQKTVTLGELAKFEIPDIPMSQQCEYASIVKKIEILREEHRAHLATLDELFASLQHRAFQGEL